MRTIIKPSIKKFWARCPKCGCEFTYEFEDIKDMFVNCPTCNKSVSHELNFPVDNPVVFVPVDKER